MFRFIHAADIHLDSPLKGLGAYNPEMADCFRRASRQAFINLVDAAIDREVAFLVIAGDIFDSDWRDYSTGLFFVQQMGRLDRAGIPVYALSGNHDAESEITKSLRYPSNVRFFSSRKPETVLHQPTGTALHGQGFSTRCASDNIALAYAPPKAGAFNIGVLHTACEGNAEHDPYAPCSLQQLCNHGYQYWALGHIHAHAVLSRDPYVVFSGNLQGRHVRECGAKGFCLVEVADNDVVAFEHICCDAARWYDLTVALENRPDPGLNMLLDQVRTRIDDAVSGAGGRPLAVRVTLTGRTGLHHQLLNNQHELRAQVEAVALSVSSDIMLEKLNVRTAEAEAASATGTFATDLVADLLQEMESPELLLAVDEEIREIITMLRQRLPNVDGVLPTEAELLDVLAEARSTVAARLTDAGDPDAD